MSDAEHNPNEKDNNTIELDQINYCLPTKKRLNTSVKSKDASFLCILLKIIFSPPGLVLIVILYSIMGAFLFPILEAPATSMYHYEIAKSREDCLKELWTITEKLNVLYEKNWTTLVHEQLRRFEGSIVAATRNSHNTDSSNVHNGVMMLSAADNGLDNGRWSFSEALLYSISVITTIGHGNFTPKTSSGKIATILYALVGVPLMLICLSSLGGLLADALQCTYSRLCCTPSKSGEIVAGTGTGKAMAATTTTVSMQMTKIKPNNGNEISAATNEVNYKPCKYDAVVGTNITSILKHKTNYQFPNEDSSCHLLHKSPTKINPKATEQYCSINNQQQQQQHSSLVALPSSGGIGIGEQNIYHQQTSFNYPTIVEPSSASATTIISCSQANNCCPNDVMSGMSVNGNGNGATTTTIYFPLTANVSPVIPIVPSPPPPQIYPLQAVDSLQNPVNSTTTFNNCSDSGDNCHQNQHSLVKYHTIHLQHPKDYATIHGTILIPTPQQQQQAAQHHTATIHGIRRSKFLAKPMPQEINNILVENDISCHQQQQQQICDGNNGNGNGNGSAGECVEIMEDEEENEQSRIGCPHGTPSRVPLISSSSSTIGSNHSPILSSIKQQISPSARRNCPKRNDDYCQQTDIQQQQQHQQQQQQLQQVQQQQNQQHQNLPHTQVQQQQQRQSKLTNTTSRNFATTCHSILKCDNFTSPEYDYTGYHNSYQQHQQQQHVPQQKKQHLQQVMPRGVGVDLIEENYDIDEGILDEDDEDEECRTGTRTATKNHENVPLVIVFLILLSYISFGTVIFAFWENWSLIDGAYFCFVTLSTIGYGDFLPKQTLLQQNTPSFQLFACCAYLLLGLVLVAMSFSILENQLLWKCKRIAVRLKLAKD